MDKLKLEPCPWCQNKAILRDFGNFMVVECQRCNTSGPSLDTRKSAIAAWNALPRAQQWTEYNGMGDETTPPTRTWLCIHNNEYGTRFAAQHRQNGKCVDPGNYVYRLQIGDRWLPWPGDK